jgi:tetratricopeptide (TPR) repeat protein
MLFCFSLSGKSQQPVPILLQSAAYWETNGEPLTAAYLYQEYITENPNAPTGIYYKCASLLLDLFHYTQARIFFQKIVDSDSLDAYPQSLFWLGMTLKNNALYDDALRYFEQYAVKYASQSEEAMQRRVLIEIDACKYAKTAFSDTLNVKIERLSDVINTPYSEYNAVQYGSEALYFASIRPAVKTEQNIVFEDFYMSKIYFAPYRVNGFNQIIPLPDHINSPKYNNGNFCFDPTFTKLYFSRYQINKKKNKHCTIWVSELEDEKWGKPHLLEKTINQPNSSAMQPCLVAVDNLEILYFVSNRAGGMGGNDIWYSILKDNHFSEPVNLGSRINTPGNEVTPFYDEKSKRLYFSSDWHKGLGGFDIFYSEGSLGAWNEVKNVGFPLNSPANDLYFTVNKEDNDGFFTSNRDGSYHFGTENCCSDIYEYSWTKKGIAIARDTFLIKNVSAKLDSVNEFSPITLYFHNDEPDPKTLNTTTSKDYESTLKEYCAMKDLYREEYAKGLSGEDKLLAENTIDNFFTETVEKGFEYLNQFMQWLYADLKRGNNIYLEIIGSASPLHSEDYNKNLSSRRISSLINYIGLQAEFKPYLDMATPTNKLHFIENPTGKKYAANYVSSNPNDMRNSVYSVAAALERKIQITSCLSQKDTLHKQAILTIADSPIQTVEKENIDLYELYLEIENSGTKDLQLLNIECDTAFFTVKNIDAALRPGQKSFLIISFPSAAFKELKTTKIRIVTDAKTEEVEVRLQIMN